MLIYQCPNCGNTYFEYEQKTRCDTCHCLLEVQGGVKDNHYCQENRRNIDEHVIGTVSNMTNINIPKCPTCGSTNIEKISLTKKATGGFLFGIFSSNVRNTFHCKHCGYKW